MRSRLPLLALALTQPFALAQPVQAREFALPFLAPSPQTAFAQPSCPPPPSPSRALHVDQAYATGDASYSKIDPRKQAARDAALRPLRAFTSGVARFANAYTASGGTDMRSGVCALKWFEAWAKAGALTQIADHDTQFVLSVNLSGWGISYMQVRDLRLAKGDPRPATLDWFRLLANNLQRHTDAIRNETARNNHRYWAGLAEMVVAVNTGEADRMRWAVDSARIGLDQVSPQGALPLELNRKQRARHYHLYAAAPLVMTAEFARAGGYDLYAYRNRALDRLVGFAITSITKPDLISKLAKTPLAVGPSQLSPTDKQNLAWIEFYAKRSPGRVPGIAKLLQNRPLRNPELGGDLTLLASSIY